jgi:polyhydroxyalkanoate synthesis regulator phasin
MPKVAGIDFSILKRYREAVSVRMPEGEVVQLPLIPLRDAGIATTYLQRNDTIAVQYSTIQARLEQKSKLIAEHSEDGLVTAEKGLDVIDDTMELIKSMYKRAEELARENHALCDEIHKFLEPYLSGTDGLAQLQECEDVYTIEVLKFMLYGEVALESDEDEGENTTEENPTIAQSQKN